MVSKLNKVLLMTLIYHNPPPNAREKRPKHPIYGSVSDLLTHSACQIGSWRANGERNFEPRRGGISIARGRARHAQRWRAEPLVCKKNHPEPVERVTGAVEMLNAKVLCHPFHGFYLFIYQTRGSARLAGAPSLYPSLLICRPHQRAFKFRSLRSFRQSPIYRDTLTF